MTTISSDKPLSPLPGGEIPAVTTVTEVSVTTAAVAVATTTIAQPQPAPVSEPAALITKSMTPSPSREKEGRIQRFVRRHFYKITDKEAKEADGIKKQIGAVKAKLETLRNRSREISRAVRRHPRPNPTSVALYSGHLLNETKPLLADARILLGELILLKKRAGELAEEHSKFSDLPEQIQQLMDKITLLNAQEELSNALIAVETAMSDYNSAKTWENFEAVREKNVALFNKFCDLAETKYTFLRTSPEFQALLKKKDVFRDASIYHTIMASFPGLRNQAERLAESTLEMNAQRIENLGNQAEVLKNSVTKYKAVAKKINNAEWWINKIQNRSLIGKIYLFFHSHGLLNLGKELKQLEKDRNRIYDTLKGKISFNPKELEWLEGQAHLDAKARKVMANNKKRLANKEDFLLITYQQRIFDLTAKLMEDLKLYRQINKNGRFTVEALAGIKTPIFAEMDELANRVQHRFSNANGNGYDHDKLNIQKLEAHIKTSFPCFQQRTERLFRLIRAVKLTEDLNIHFNPPPPAAPIDPTPSTDTDSSSTPTESSAQSDLQAQIEKRKQQQEARRKADEERRKAEAEQEQLNQDLKVQLKKRNQVVSSSIAEPEDDDEDWITD